MGAAVTPLVSVIMSVYNGAELAPGAIASILDQTFGDFELIAIDNGSFKDDTRDVLNRIAGETCDPRLRIVTLDKNIGLAGALNHGIGLARGRYIARQDHDDLSQPTRLEKQVAFLEANPDVGLLGTRAEIWVGNEPTARAHDHPVENAALQIDMLTNNPFVHTSIMMRKSVLDQVGAYTTDPERQPPEDYELWSRIARVSQLANLPERLVVYREMPASMSRVGHNPFLDKLLPLSAENFAWWNGLAAPDEACRDCAAVLNGAYDRVSPKAALAVLVSRCSAALAAIEARHGSAGAGQRADQLIANLQHHFMLARRLPDWAKPLVTLGRKLPVPSALKSWAKSQLTR
ncbi:glycosyltransferase family 2 protein [Bosea sp. (in: a-proteobacteria)]|uniref:glycosyltransferase family 2 protein n=1 Tax=Bosea sp. (in: a-proteobacteria) TaxID=1871050 RepID=UPI003F6F265C